MASGSPRKQAKPEGQKPTARSATMGWWLLLVFMLVLGLLYFGQRGEERSEIDYGIFYRELEKNNVASVDVRGRTILGEFRAPPADPGGRKDSQGAPLRLKKRFSTTVPPEGLADEKLGRLLIDNVGEKYKVTEESDHTFLILAVYVLLTVGLFAGLWLMLRRTRDQVFGAGLMGGFGKSTARRYEPHGEVVTFADVAGLEEAKRDLQEIVEYLKDPQRFERLGGRVPKGVLLLGPPGTGKTLLGRAVAGEAGVPFFSVNGSEFIQMFVGVGASRVRDLFATAKENAPCILFIDEIDAVGRYRGAGLGGGHDEREQTLNQILGEMDGFTPSESVIVMAATNRPDVLDPALLRPGRFDRHITIDRPSFRGRVEIFKVHVRGVPLAEDVDLEKLGGATVGLTGADIRNVVNEAALWASRQEKQSVDMADFEYALDKVLLGSKREEVLKGREKSITAYHEAGHALAAWLVPIRERLRKVSIIPRGRTLGSTMVLPEDDPLSLGETQLRNMLLFIMAGRAAEKLVFGEFSAGGANDLDRATQLARAMVARFGMSERLGPAAFRDGEEHPFLGKEMAEPRRFSEHTARLIDEEVVRILREAAEQASELLRHNREKLDALARALLREETLHEAQIEALIGPPNRREDDAADDLSRPADAPPESPSPVKTAADSSAAAENQRGDD